MKTKFLILTVFTLLLMAACQSESVDGLDSETSLKEIPVKEPIYANLGDLSHPSATMKMESGKEIQVILYSAEYFTAGNSGEMGNTIFFNSIGGIKQNPFTDFVPDFYLDFTDKTNDITYYVDENRAANVTGVLSSTEAIDRAMTTWDDVTCSELGITKVSYDPSINTGATAGRWGYGDPVNTLTEWVADVVHAGWMTGDFFKDPRMFFPPDGDEYILGATFTYIVVFQGQRLDLDNNGKWDVWHKEIYYNENFQWTTDGSGDTPPFVDVETVALHETGHGLSQLHFGKGFTNKGGVHYSPRAVMNASYSGIQTTIRGTDNAAHCGNWVSWPDE